MKDGSPVGQPQNRSDSNASAKGRVVAGAARRSWSCERCGVKASWVAGPARGRPASWSDDATGIHCLSCRRAIAGELALAAAQPHRTSTAPRIRTAGIISFEIARDPGRSNSVIARVCRTSVPAVSRVRSSLPDGGSS